MRPTKHAVFVVTIVTLIFAALLSSPPSRLTAAGEFGLQFDGLDDRVTFGQALNLGAPQFTLELWFMKTGAGVATSTGTGGINAIPLVTKGRAEAEASNVDMNYFLGIEPTKRVLAVDFEDTINGGNHPFLGKTAICDNIWYHAAATYDGSTWRLYLNGELDGELAVGAFTPRADSIQHAALGTAMTSTGAAAGFFKGQMDEVRIWNSALGQSTIQANMGGPLVGLPTGLLGRWSLDDGTGTIATSSIGPNGTLAPAAPLTPPTWVAGGSHYVSTPLPAGNYALKMAGTVAAADYVTFGAAPALGASKFTVETWFRREATGVSTSTGTGGLTAALPLVTKGRAEAEASNVDMNYFLGINTAGTSAVLAADFEEGAGGLHPGDNHPISGVTPIALNTWYHAAVTYDGNALQLYLNGAPDGAAVVVGQPPRFDSIQHAAIGSALTSTGAAAGFFAGSIDEARVWNYARNPAQIQAGANREIPNAFGLLAHWSFNECCGRVADSTTRIANGTLMGTGWSWASNTAFSAPINTAPFVSAGADASVTLPALGALQGTVIDDNANTGTPLVVKWAKKSGPGSVSFGDAGSAVTSASFSDVGTYVLTLSADDGELSGQDDVIVSVSGLVNLPPSVSAGSDLSITMPVDSVALQGSATDDGLPGGPLSYHWSKVSGPGSVTFADANVASTVATFSAEGAYVLQLSASDGLASGQSSLTVTVAPNASNSAVKLGGTNASISLGAAPQLGAARFTLEAWMRRDGAGVATFTGTGGITAVPLITKGMAEVDNIDNRDMNYFFGINSATGTLAADFEDTATSANHPINGTTPIVADGRWHHVAAAFDGTTWRLYLDGQLDGSLAVGAFTPRADSIQHAALGTALNSTGAVTAGQTQGFFNGVLDEVRIWNYARSQAQIAGGMNREIGAASGMLGRWGMNEGAGSSIADSSANNLTGAISGSNWSWVSGAHMTGSPNAAPVVDAGGDATVTLPGAGMLMGSVTDDGISGGPVTVQWSQVSGPAAASFSAPASGVTMVDFLALGTYVLRLTASDGELSASDDLQIVVDGMVNLAPVVDAGADQAITLPVHAVSLAGSVLDDGMPSGSLTAQWSSVSGPAPVVFGSASANATSATFSMDGTYVLRLTGNDGSLSGSDTVTVIVSPNPANKALRLGGTNGFIALGPSGLGARMFTLETWFRRDGAGVATSTGTGGVVAIPLISKGMAEVDNVDNRDMNYFLGIRQSDGVLVADFEDMATAANHPIAGATVIPAGSAWHHAAATYDGTVWNLYLDGRLERSLSVGQTPRFDSIQHAAIGSALNSTGGVGTQAVGLFNGAIDEARIWNYARSAGQINRGMLLEISSATPGLMARFGLDETAGSVAANSVASGPAGDIRGTDSSRVPGAPFTGANAAPAAADDSASTTEDASVSIDVLSNDSDADGDSIAILIAAAPGHGTATVSGGTISYAPAANYNGADSFSYTISDGQGGSASATVSVSIAAANDAPIASADSASTDEDTAVNIAVLGNDSDPDGDPLSVVIVSAPANGSAAVNPDGTIRYTPAANFNGSDSFSYKVNDGSIDSGAVIVTVSVAAVNDAPAAVADAFSVDEDATLQVDAAGVLSNDTDADGDMLSASLVNSPAHGSLTFNADGSFIYTPDANYSGADSFTYQVNDGIADSSAVAVSLTVRAVNDAPLAADDAYSTAEDTPLVIAAAGVLSNDHDIDGDALHAALVTAAANGSVALNADGSFTYTPNANFNGTDTFSYQAGDGSDNSLAVVTITVTAVNDAPVAAADSYNTDEDAPLTIGGPGVLGNDSDVEGSALVAVLVSGPSHGTLALSGDGSFSYVPEANFHGADSFSYKADDGSDRSGVATVSITVASVNDQPAAADDSYSTNEDAPLTIAAAGVLGNDTDADGDALRALVVSGPAHGTLSLNADGGFLYTPAANFAGRDSFTYTAGDGTVESNVATVSLTVSAVNDAPVAQGEGFNTNEDTALNVGAPGVLSNDSDVENDSLTAILVSTTSHGSLTLNADGSFAYAPEANFHGLDSFTYRASDGTDSSAPVTVTIEVASVNDAPVAIDDAVSTTEDTPLAVAAPGVLGNDTDLEGGALTAILVAGASHGSVTLLPDGSFNYVPQANFSGSDSFTYKVNDGSADSAPATVTVSVGNVSDPPVASADAFSTAEDMPLEIGAPGVLANDSDPDGDQLAAVLIGGPAHGTLTLHPDGSFSYVPAANYNGADSFTYQVSAGGATSAVTTVSLNVTSVPDAPVAGANSYIKNEDVALLVAAPGVLGNDSDVEGDPLRAILVSGPSHGTLTLNADGSFAYLPEANYNGPDSFTYAANDGLLSSAPALVTITVRAVNDPPVAGNDSYSVAEDGVLSIGAPGLLANDSDVDSPILTAVKVTNPAHGTVTVNADGSFIYRPAANYSGPDSFTYRARDAATGSNTATVTLVVNPMPDAPVAANQARSLNEDSSRAITLTASDADGDALTFAIVSGPAHGTLTGSGANVTYVPAANYNGPDSFTFVARDAALTSNVATVALTVNPVNDAPVAQSGAYTGLKNTRLFGQLVATDVEGSPLTYTITTAPTRGTVFVNPSTGAFVYTPQAGKTGTDSFRFKASDGSASSNAGRIDIDIR